MKKRKVLINSAILFYLTILCSGVLQAGDISGKWNGKIEIPDYGTYEMVMVIEKTDSGFKAKVSDTVGYIADGTEVKALKIEGNKLTGSFDGTDNTVVTLNLTVEGDSMAGEAVRMGNSAPCVFEKEK
jgi:hypothetical protein